MYTTSDSLRKACAKEVTIPILNGTCLLISVLIAVEAACMYVHVDRRCTCMHTAHMRMHNCHKRLLARLRIMRPSLESLLRNSLAAHPLMRVDVVCREARVVADGVPHTQGTGAAEARSALAAATAGGRGRRTPHRRRRKGGPVRSKGAIKTLAPKLRGRTRSPSMRKLLRGQASQRRLFRIVQPRRPPWATCELGLRFLTACAGVTHAAAAIC
jgi:hypothetical protein